MKANDFYPIGLAGTPWGEWEREQWRARQSRQRSYADDVVSRIDALCGEFDRVEYGQLAHGCDTYALCALRSRRIDPALPNVLITGGVHGYETSGIMGALDFIEHHAAAYAGRINLLVVPCVSPWAYERISRWNDDAVDPNRNFRPDGPSREATALIQLVRSAADRYLLHIDLHETTDSDETEFRRALSARDGTSFEPGEVPDGFYLVADTADPQLAFQSAIIAAVGKVTGIAAPDDRGAIIGQPVIADGVIAYPLADLGLCTSITQASFVTTTEIYPDAPSTTLNICVEAQVTAICAALDYALAHRPGAATLPRQ